MPSNGSESVASGDMVLAGELGHAPQKIIAKGTVNIPVKSAKDSSQHIGSGGDPFEGTVEPSGELRHPIDAPKTNQVAESDHVKQADGATDDQVGSDHDSLFGDLQEDSGGEAEAEANYGVGLSAVETEEKSEGAAERYAGSSLNAPEEEFAEGDEEEEEEEEDVEKEFEDDAEEEADEDLNRQVGFNGSFYSSYNDLNHQMEE